MANSKHWFTTPPQSLNASATSFSLWFVCRHYDVTERKPTTSDDVTTEGNYITLGGDPTKNDELIVGNDVIDENDVTSIDDVKAADDVRKRNDVMLLDDVNDDKAEDDDVTDVMTSECQNILSEDSKYDFATGVYITRALMILAMITSLGQMVFSVMNMIWTYRFQDSAILLPLFSIHNSKTT